MTSKNQVQLYTYTIHLQSVTMNIKFACKMKLEYNGSILGSQIASNESGKFIFNQEIILHQEMNRKEFEILIYLNTDKGSKYIAGVIQLSPQQLSHQEGEVLAVPLQRCLDPGAICQFRVDQISSRIEKSSKNYSKTMNKSIIQDSPPRLNLDGQRITFTTKSQLQPAARKFVKESNGSKKIEQNKKINHNTALLHNKIPHQTLSARYQFPQHDFDSSNRQKLVQAQIYKESYQKLKQKYKKQTEALKHEQALRIGLQSRENTYKLDIIRLKLKSEQQEKIVNQKHEKIKQLQLKLSGFQQKQYDLSFLRQELESKDHTIRMLQQTIVAANKDNQSLKSLNRQNLESHQIKLKQIRDENDQRRHEYQQKIQQLGLKLRKLDDVLQNREIELKIKNQRIVRQERTVDELESTIEANSRQYQNNLQSQRTSHQQIIQQLEIEIKKMEGEKDRMAKQLSLEKNTAEDCKKILIKIQYDKKMAIQDNEKMKIDISELKVVKDRYQTLLKEHQHSKSEKSRIQTQLQKIIKGKENDINQLKIQYDRETNNLKKILKQAQQKYKATHIKHSELQTAFQFKKKQYQKLKKNQEQTQKQKNLYQNREDSLKKQIKQRQHEIQALMRQVSGLKNKSRGGDQIFKVEIENLRQNLQQTQKQLIYQLERADQLSSKNTKMNEEIGNLNMKIQFATDQNEKVKLIDQQKIDRLTQNIQTYQRKIQILEAHIDTLRGTQKQYQARVQNYELYKLQIKQQLFSREHQISTLKENLKAMGERAAQKYKEYDRLTQERDIINKKLQSREEECNGLRANFGNMTGQQNKNQRIKELLNAEITEHKAHIQKLSIQAKQNQQTIEEYRLKLSKLREDAVKQQIKYNSIRQQYERFKQIINLTLTSTFSELSLPTQLSTNIASQILPINSKLPQLNNSISEITDKIKQQKKQIRCYLDHLIEQNKIKSRQIDQLNDNIKNKSTYFEAGQEQLKRNLENLEGELRTLESSSHKKCIQFEEKITQLLCSLQQKHESEQLLKQQVQQLQFTISSLKMDHLANLDNFERNQKKYLSKLEELEEKWLRQKKMLEELTTKYQLLQAKYSRNQSKLQEYCTKIDQKDAKISQLISQLRSLQSINEESKQQKKQLITKSTQLEYRLKSSIEINEKERNNLIAMEQKNKELKNFIAQLMKQKEQAIKSALEKNQIIIGLEVSFNELKIEKDCETAQKYKLAKQKDDYKTVIKNNSGKIKELEYQLQEIKQKNVRYHDRCKDSEQKLLKTNEELAIIIEKYDKLEASNTKIITDLQSKREQIERKFVKLKKQYENQVQQLTGNYQQSNINVGTLKKQLAAIEQKLYEIRQKYNKQAEEKYRLGLQIQQFNLTIKNWQGKSQKLNKQLEQKDENSYVLSSRIYELQNIINNMKKEIHDKIQQVNSDWKSRLDSQILFHQQTVLGIEKQRQFFRENYTKAEEQSKKLAMQQKSMEIDYQNDKKILSQKIKRLEAKRLQLITIKNEEINKLNQDNKNYFEELKHTQGQIRKIKYTLDRNQNKITQLEKSKREIEYKNKERESILLEQIKLLKNRQARSQIEKQNIGRIQWEIQRQMKRTFQSHSRRLIDGQDIVLSKKMMLIFRNIEEQILTQIVTRLKNLE